MNDSVDIEVGVFSGSAVSTEAGTAVSKRGSGEVWQAVQHILASEAFIKAPRMCQLLSFLMKKKLSGTEHLITEYAIGLEVFRRDVRLYDTCLDPVVRVQVGRLRGRLEAYYAALAAPPEIQIAIPAGSYVPVLTQGAVIPDEQARGRLQLAPLRNLTCTSDATVFVSGLEEELGAHLFHALGRTVEFMVAGANAVPPDAASMYIGHRLEGTVRVERQHVRASMRLVKAGAGKIAWLSQFDCNGVLGMSLQEELALAICHSVQRYFTGAPAAFDAEKVSMLLRRKLLGTATSISGVPA